ncbi:MAG: single-stranded DNA-binding protein [Bacteroidia bacterium]
MSVNKVILLGNLGRDPDVRYLDSNRVVATFPLATNEVYTDRKGNRIRQTEWHNIELWDSLARIAEKYLKKGYTIYLEGKIRTDNWTDKEGVSRSQKKIRGINITIVNKEKNKFENEHLPVEAKDDDLHEGFNESYTDEDYKEGDLS